MYCTYREVLDMLASKKMKETIKYKSSSCIPREVINLSFSERLVEQQVFVLSIRRYWLHTYTICKISYNLLAFELNFHMVFSGFIDDVVKKESRQFLLNCFY